MSASGTVPPKAYHEICRPAGAEAASSVRTAEDGQTRSRREDPAAGSRIEGNHRRINRKAPVPPLNHQVSILALGRRASMPASNRRKASILAANRRNASMMVGNRRNASILLGNRRVCGQAVSPNVRYRRPGSLHSGNLNLKQRPNPSSDGRSSPGSRNSINGANRTNAADSSRTWKIVLAVGHTTG